jgi:hypothetical protein
VYDRIKFTALGTTKLLRCIQDAEDKVHTLPSSVLKTSNLMGVTRRFKEYNVLPTSSWQYAKPHIHISEERDAEHTGYEAGLGRAACLSLVGT